MGMDCLACFVMPLTNCLQCVRSLNILFYVIFATMLWDPQLTHDATEKTGTDWLVWFLKVGNWRRQDLKPGLALL